TNCNQAKLSNYHSDILATLMAVGIRYKVLSNVSLLGEVEKQLYRNVNAKVGLTYAPLKIFKINFGLNTSSRKVFTGIGLDSRKISFWCSYSYNYYLLSGIQLTLKYRFK
ncbi:MAG TPA: hypothetical protein VL947_11000, partial [Cytophagales bacterium]|nr:hypothetical protein [Cytophagales bacterium]